MSVVAWDGKTLAADRAASCAGLVFPSRKIWRLDCGTVVATTGAAEVGLALLRWFKEGRKRELWPAIQSDKEQWSRLIFATPEGNCYWYEMLPEKQTVESDFDAWGAGRDFALGALAMGADARTAVRVASQFSDSCGHGVEAFDLIPDAVRVGPERNAHA